MRRDWVSRCFFFVSAEVFLHKPLVWYWRNRRFSFQYIILIKLSVFHAQAAWLILCPERQSMQNALLCLQSEKTKNHRQAVIYPIVQDKMRGNTLFLISVSVIFRFLLSAYHLLFTARLCLKQLFIKDTAAFLLSLSIVIVCHASLSLLFTISLPDSRGPLFDVLFSFLGVVGSDWRSFLVWGGGWFAAP